MKTFTSLTIFYLLLMIPSLSIAQWISFHPGDTSSKPQQANVEIENNTSNEMVIKINVYGMLSKTVHHEGQEFQQLEIPGCGFTQDVGKPRLPMFGRYIALPENASITVEELSSEAITLDNIHVYPTQAPQMESSPQNSLFEYDPDVYFSPFFYPTRLFFLEGPYVIRGLRFNIFRICPVQYKPSINQITAYPTIRLKINFLDAQGDISIDQRLRSEPFDNMFKKMFLNLPTEAMMDPNSRKRMASETGHTFLIITHPNFLAAAQKLQTWKIQKGIECIVKTTTDTGQTSSELRTYIQTAYDSWTHPPTYILLMGDAEYIPVNYETTHPYSGGKIGTDLYYTTVDGDDYFPDISIGRMSVDTNEQALKRVDDTIHYEKGLETNTNFYHNATICAYFQDDNQDGKADRRFAQTSEDIALFMENNPFPAYTVKRIYVTEHHVMPLFWSTEWFGGGLAGTSGAPVPARLQKPVFPWTGSKENINDAINSGSFLVTHRDHGSSTGWGDPAYDVKDVLQLSNHKKLPFVLSINCKTGWFDDETDETTGSSQLCFSEAWERNEKGGAIGVIAATRVSYSGHNDRLVWGWIDAIWPNFNTDYQAANTPFDNPMWEMGNVLNYGKYYYASQYNDDLYRQISFEMFHWFGDPTLQIRTEPPRTFDIFFPETLTVGATSVTLSIDEPGALICISKEHSILGKNFSEVNTSGVALSRSLVMGESIHVVVSKHNFQTWETDIVIQEQVHKLVPDFIVDRTVTGVGEPLYFRDQSIGRPTFWKWDFNADGIIDDTRQNPSFTYQDTGIYSVCLTIGNESMTECITKTNFIYVDNPMIFVVPSQQEVSAEKGYAAFPVQIKCAGKTVGVGHPWSVQVKNAPWMSITSITNTKTNNLVYLSYEKNFGTRRRAEIEFNADGTLNSPYVVTILQYEASGSLMVNILADTGISKQAKWKTQDSEWQDSGSIINNLPVGDYAITFYPISLWTHPQNVSLHVNCDETTVFQAVYQPLGKELSILASGQGSIQINDDPPVKVPLIKRFTPNTDIQVKAIPDACWEFSFWSTPTSTDNPVKLIMNQDIQLTANFISKCPQLCIQQQGEGNILMNDIPISTPCCHTLSAGEVYNLQANGQNGFQFKTWDGDIRSTEHIISRHLYQNTDVTAVFEKNDSSFHCDINVLADKFAGQYKSSITIGVSDTYEQLEATPMPPYYSCDSGIYKDIKYKKVIEPIGSSEYIWTIGINPHGNKGNPEPSSVTVWWLSEQLLEKGQYSMYQGDHIISEPIIPDMRLVSNFWVTGENKTYYYTIHYENKDSLCYDLNLPQSYSLISLKVKPADCLPNRLFPDSKVICGYDDGGYVTDDCMQEGKGYWVNMENQHINKLCGEPFYFYRVELEAGWHMLGAVYTEETPKTEPSNAVAVIYEYVNGEYRQTDTMKPDQGYWVLITERCWFELGLDL
ncbi:MAG: hypothetical protein HQK75_17735 [Candidatus Magnetomorum sp.]|nr:hypothetical protein [Candidatus Magnetomorum sp.]